MKPKQWLFYWVISTTALLFLIFITNLFLINPFNVYNYANNFDLTEFKFKYNNLTSKVVYENLKHKKATLIFGTSRSAKISSSMINKNVLNNNGLYGNPHSILNFLLELDPIQINNIEKIYFIIDTHCLKSKDHLMQGYRHVYHKNYYLEFVNLLNYAIDINTSITTYEYFKNILSGGYIQKIDKYSSAIIPIKSHLNRSFSSSLNWNTNLTDDYFEYHKDAINALSMVHQFISNHNINHCYFTPTLTPHYLSTMDLHYEEEKYQSVLNVIDELHFLHYIEGVSDYYKNGKFVHFTNPSHLNYNCTKFVIEKIIPQKKYLVKNKSELHAKFKTIHLKKEKNFGLPSPIH